MAFQLRDRDARPSRSIPGDDVLDYRSGALRERLGALQGALRAEGKRALLVVLQGRDTSGKDGTIKNVFESVDPQGCAVTNFGRPSDLELSHDYLWRVHQAIPPLGLIGIFNRSHYEDVLAVRVHELVPRKEWSRRFRQINDFERMLSENGVTTLKFFLHISRQEQKERLLARLDDPNKNWKFSEADLGERKLWGQYTRAYRDALARCSTRWAPWYVIPADKKPVRDYLVARVIVQTLRRMAPKYPAADPALIARARSFA